MWRHKTQDAQEYIIIPDQDTWWKFIKRDWFLKKGSLTEPMPSIRVRREATTRFSTSFCAPSRFGHKASSSSMKMMAGCLLIKCTCVHNIWRVRWCWHSAKPQNTVLRLHLYNYLKGSRVKIKLNVSVSSLFSLMGFTALWSLTGCITQMQIWKRQEATLRYSPEFCTERKKSVWLAR